jgi:hypothetical protein
LIDKLRICNEQIDSYSDIQTFITKNPTGIYPPECVVKDYIRQCNEAKEEAKEKELVPRSQEPISADSGHRIPDIITPMQTSDLQTAVSGNISWQEFIDPDSNMHYFLNIDNGKVQWVAPDEPYIPAESAAGSVTEDDDEDFSVHR